MSKTKTTEQPAPISEKEPWYWFPLGGFAIICAGLGFVHVAGHTFSGIKWVCEALSRGHASGAIDYQTFVKLEKWSELDAKVVEHDKWVQMLNKNYGESMVDSITKGSQISKLQSQVEDLSKKLERKQDKFSNPWYDTIIITNLAVSNMIHFDQPVDTIYLTNGAWRVK